MMSEYDSLFTMTALNMAKFETELPPLKFTHIIEKAENGYAVAQCLLGLTYEEGEEVKQNYSEAVKWYLKAAEQGVYEDPASNRLNPAAMAGGLDIE